MKTKHTPGPWIDAGGMPAKIVGPEKQLVAKPLAHTAQTIDEYRANARLIAAAPELLAALEELIYFLHDGKLRADQFSGAVLAMNDRLHFYRAAINKATGQ